MKQWRKFSNFAYVNNLCVCLFIFFLSISVVFSEAALAQSGPIKIGVLTIRSGPASPIGDEILTWYSDSHRDAGQDRWAFD